MHTGEPCLCAVKQSVAAFKGPGNRLVSVRRHASCAKAEHGHADVTLPACSNCTLLHVHDHECDLSWG